jgi:hypothetical protein
VWLGALFVHLPLHTEDASDRLVIVNLNVRFTICGWCKRRTIRLSEISRQPFCDITSGVGRCKLGFKQYSLRHTHLALTLHATNGFDASGLTPDMLLSPASFEVTVIADRG